MSNIDPFRNIYIDVAFKNISSHYDRHTIAGENWIEMLSIRDFLRNREYRLCFPPLFVFDGVAEHFQEHALEQRIELLQVLLALGDQAFHFAEQMGNALLVVEGREGDFKLLDT